MKRITFLLILFYFIGTSGYSQIEKKTLLLGGYTDIQLSTDNSNFHLILNPNIGYFVSDKFCIGISLPIGFINDNFYWGMTPFGRYYST